jgi:DNA-3-methyladenine glycosylase
MRYSENGMSTGIKSPIENMSDGVKLTREFFTRDVLDVAPEIPGKILVVKTPEGHLGRYRITDVEAYRGSEDRACHAFKGRTPRTEIMFDEGGRLYIYFIYGMYWMLNIVTSIKDNPQAVLIRGVDGISGPGRLTKSLGIDKTFNGEDITISDRIWLEDGCNIYKINTGTRIGIDYAGDLWKNKPWRFYL